MIDEDFEEEDPDGVNSTFFSGETEEIAKQLIDTKHLVELWEIAQKNDELKKKNCRKLLQKLEELAEKGNQYEREKQYESSDAGMDGGVEPDTRTSTVL